MAGGKTKQQQKTTKNKQTNNKKQNKTTITTQQQTLPPRLVTGRFRVQAPAGAAGDFSSPGATCHAANSWLNETGSAQCGSAVNEGETGIRAISETKTIIMITCGFAACVNNISCSVLVNSH